VSHPFILDMPMKLGLKLMASVSSNRMNAKGEFFNHIINKLNGVYLIVTRIDFQRPDPGGIINGGILKTSDSVALKVSQGDKFHINLDMMAWNFFAVTSRVNSTAWGTLGQASRTVSNQSAINTGNRSFNSVVALQIPGDSLGPEFLFLSQMKDLINDILI
jgi:hypothetical protein